MGGSIIVNDWGSAVPSMSNPEIYSGVFIEGSSNILDALKRNKVPQAKPSDDLHALAQTLFRFMYNIPEKNLSSFNYHKSLKTVDDFWKMVDANWLDILTLVDKANQIHMKNFLLLYHIFCLVYHVNFTFIMNSSLSNNVCSILL